MRVQIKKQRNRLLRCITKTQPKQSISTTYTYDNIYRLIQAMPSGGSYQTEAYTYDQVGNRLTSSNEQTPETAETTTYGYDDENRLTSVRIIQNSKTKELTFAYDPFGRRISKTIVKDEIGTACTTGVCPRTTTYLYDNRNIILEYDTNNEVQTRYTHGINTDEPLSIEVKTASTYTPYYYHADGLGSITALTNTSGNIIQRYEYDSFGNITITANGGINQPYTFTAREYDNETGMYFYRARYYDSRVGRFITKDPISFAGGDVNLYGYVGNNPVNWGDPLGLYSTDEFIQDAANYSAGFGDTITFGVTDWIRDQTDANTAVNKCSGAYTAGEVSGYAWEIAMGVSGSARALGGWSINFNKYKHGGGGVNLLNDGARKFGADWHQFKQWGEMVNRPHYHRGLTKNQMRKHRPWQGGW